MHNLPAITSSLSADAMQRATELNTSCVIRESTGSSNSYDIIHAQCSDNAITHQSILNINSSVPCKKLQKQNNMIYCDICHFNTCVNRSRTFYAHNRCHANACTTIFFTRTLSFRVMAPKGFARSNVILVSWNYLSTFPSFMHQSITNFKQLHKANTQFS